MQSVCVTIFDVKIDLYLYICVESFKLFLMVTYKPFSFMTITIKTAELISHNVFLYQSTHVKNIEKYFICIF